MDLIKSAPELVNLFLYGLVFMLILKWLTSADIDMNLLIIDAIFANVVIKAICGAIHSVILKKVEFNDNLKIVMYIVTAIIMSCLVSWLYNSVVLKKILYKIGKKTFGNDLFKDVIDYDKRTMMMVYLKNSNIMYGGVFRAKDEHGTDSYISLIEYNIYNKENNEIVRRFDEQKASVAINLNDIERIEMIYEEDSKVWEFLKQDDETENEDSKKFLKNILQKIRKNKVVYREVK